MLKLPFWKPDPPPYWLGWLILAFFILGGICISLGVPNTRMIYVFAAAGVFLAWLYQAKLP
jgi:hypothetical protein